MKTRWEFVQYLLSFPSTDRWCQWALVACNDDDHNNSKVWSYMMKKSQHDACRYDEHWRPVSVHCSPCNFPFTHIIHFESLQVDGLVDMLERILAKKPRCDSSNFSFPYLTAFYFSDTRLKRDFSWRSSAKRSLEACQGCLNFFSLESSTW